MSELDDIVDLAAGPERTAALAAWFQGLFEAEAAPVLVGGAAVELFTDGAYLTGDLDFIGRVSAEVAVVLRENGFRKAGRHWIREEGKVFLELPGSALGPDEVTVELRRGSVVVRSLAPEDLVVDRLAAWRFWDSAEDAANAFLIWRANDLDRGRLRLLARRREVIPALESLTAFRDRWTREDPTAEELSRWAGLSP